jgi:hypothetical protein
MNRDATQQAFGKLHRMPELLRNSFRHAPGFARNFDTNPVSGQQQDFQMHR